MVKPLASERNPTDDHRCPRYCGFTSISRDCFTTKASMASSSEPAVTAIHIACLLSIAVLLDSVVISGSFSRSSTL